MFSRQYYISEKDLDLEYLHVHHATLLLYLEKCRLELVEAIGFPIKHFIAQNLFVVIKCINVRYLREVKGGNITVTCEEERELTGPVKSPTPVREFSLFQRIITENGKEAVAATVTLAILSREVGRAIVPPNEFMHALVSSIRTVS